MKPFLILATIVTLVGGFAPTTFAWGDFKEDHCRNKNWPWPYICPDRTYARAPFHVMTQNGWRRQNIMGSHHFDDQTSKLTTAGQLKVQWIMTQAPEQFRKVYIERSIDPTVTDRRMRLVQEYAVVLSQSELGTVPGVYATNLMEEGRPATTVDAINVRFQESMPAPVLPSATAENFD
jgi:hypothetical protein